MSLFAISPSKFETAQAAAGRISARSKGRASSGVDPADLADMTVYGAAKIAAGVVNLAQWTGEMVKVFGEAMRPHAEALYKAAKDHIAAGNKASPAGEDIDAARQAHIDSLNPKDFQTASTTAAEAPQARQEAPQETLQSSSPITVYAAMRRILQPRLHLTKERKGRIGWWLAGIAFALFIWPTPWQYDKSGRLSVRTERITGEVQSLGYEGWQTTNSGWAYKRLHHQTASAVIPAPPPPAPQMFLTREEINGIQQDSASLYSGGEMTANYYNGSDKTISAITLTIGIKSRNSNSADVIRDYRMEATSYGSCTPQANCVFTTSQAYPIDASTQTWYVVGIKNATIFH